MADRLDHLENVLQDREWLSADRFTAADLLMADVLRVPKIRSFGDRPATEAYVARVTERPSFKKAHADQLAHFAAADRQRTEEDAYRLGRTAFRQDTKADGRTNQAHLQHQRVSHQHE